MKFIVKTVLLLLCFVLLLFCFFAFFCFYSAFVLLLFCFVLHLFCFFAFVLLLVFGFWLLDFGFPYDLASFSPPQKYNFLFKIFNCQTILCRPEMSTVVRKSSISTSSQALFSPLILLN